MSESETIDNYTEEQYNNFGWITDNNLVSAQERETLFSRYADYKHNRDKYPTTRFGEAVIHSTECPDVIMYVKGEIGEPNITKVVRINTNNPRTIAKIKENILKNERRQIYQPYDFVRAYFGEELLSVDRKRDYESFWEVKARIERERSQASNTDSGTSQDRTGSIQQNSQADRADLKRSAFSLSEQGNSPTEYGNLNIYGEDVKLDTTPSEDIAPVKESVSLTESIETDLEKAISDYVENNLEDVAADIKVLKTKNIFAGTRKGFVRILSDGTYESGVEGTGSGGFVPNENVIRTDSLEEALSKQYKYMLESLPDTATVYFKNKKELNSAVGVTNNLRSLAANVEFIDKTVSQKNENVKQKQLEIILETNPAYSDSFTWIRKVEDIHTLEETLSLSDWKYYDEFDPDLTKSDILKAIESGKITVYSSHPIENGAFVTPSRMEAETYAGTGKVYQKTVDINDVTWIDPTQGQLAKINGNTNDLVPVKFSLSEPETIDNYTEEQYNNFGWTRYNEVLDNNDIKYITQEIQK